MIDLRGPVLLGRSVNQFIQCYFFTLTDTERGASSIKFDIQAENVTITAKF